MPILKHVAVRHGGLLTITPDAVRISTQVPLSEKDPIDSTVTITRVNGKRFTLGDVTEVSVIHTRKQE
jgi:hypothetical protein